MKKHGIIPICEVDMSRTSKVLSLALLLSALIAACDRKPTPAQQAQDAAKAADAHVAQLEQQIADAKAGKAGAASKGQLKAMEKDLKGAKEAADQAHQDAQQQAQQAQQPDAAPAAPAPPKVVTVDVPAQTPLSVILDRDLSTAKDHAGDGWTGKLAAAVSINGQEVWPAGTPVKGVVAQSDATGRLQSGQGGLGIRISTIGAVDVEAGVYQVAGANRGTRDAKFAAGGAALGALAGILSSKHHQGDHALGGAAIGALAGTGAAAATADTTLTIPASKPVGFTLARTVQVTLK
jgi:proline-rich tail region repeat protein